MHLSVAHTFERGIIPRLAAIDHVEEIFGKISDDPIGGGRSSFTMRRTGKSDLVAAVAEAHRHNLRYSYLLNTAGLSGLEQTRTGQRAIRRHLEFLDDAKVDGITVSLPYLCTLTKKLYPHWKIKIGAFAMIDSPMKARQWEDLGADELCLSSISCARNFPLLRSLRDAVSIKLQLIANASCLLSCVHEPTHMHLLSQSSGKGARHGGFVLDYCFLNCSKARLSDPLNLIKAVWIRPEDMSIYEAVGIDSFKIVERSCPGDLLTKRAQAYSSRSFEGNLWEIVGPVAQIKKESGASRMMRLRMIFSQLRPHLVNIRTLLQMKQYAEAVIPHDFGRESAAIYIDNAKLNGFLTELIEHNCNGIDCESCAVCERYSKKAIIVNDDWKRACLKMSEELNAGMYSGAHWE